MKTNNILKFFDYILLNIKERNHTPRLAILGFNVYLEMCRQLDIINQEKEIPIKISNCPIVLCKSIDPNIIEFVFEENPFLSLVVRVEN